MRLFFSRMSLIIPLLVMAMLSPAFATTTAGAPANPVSPEEFQHLVEVVTALEKNNAALREELTTLRREQAELRRLLPTRNGTGSGTTPIADSGSADDALSDLEKELEGAISGTPPRNTEGVKTAAQTSLGMSGTTNPDMGAVGIITYTGARRNAEEGGSEAANTFQFDEAELNIAGYVDPFHKYDLVLGFHEDEVGVEEAYLSKFDLPWKLAGRLGKWRSSLGFINQHHVDELPWAGELAFTDAFLGREGLTTTGLELKKALDRRGRWTPTLSVEVGSGEDHTPADPDPREDINPYQDLTYAQNRRTLARLRNHFDLGPRKDLAVGFSYLAADHGELDILGADFQFRTRPQSYLGWTVLGEYLRRRDDAFAAKRSLAGFDHLDPEGYFLNLDYQWDPLWKAGVVISEFDGTHRLASGLCRSRVGYVAFLKTEFTRYLLQLEEREMSGLPRDRRATLQLIFNTGYHRHKLK